MAIYYYDGTTLGNSTAIFTDSSMSVCATDGFYSDGVIVRELSGCTLLPEQVCGTCATPCGGNISGSGDQGIYLLDLDAGGTSSDVGAVIIKFDPASIPDGIRATYNNVVYNKLSSPIDGYHASTNPSNFTYVGRTSSDCGISGTTYPNLIEKNYVNGGFVATGNTQSITVAPGDVSLGTSSPGNCIMVVPKTLATPTLINLEFVGPCSSTAWNISVSCPTALPSFSSSVKAAKESDACSLPLNQTYYFASHTSAATPAIYDWVFGDSFGMNVLENGFYKVGNNFIQVQNGLVVAIGSCDTNTNSIRISDCLTSELQTADNQFNNVVGDVIQYQVGVPGSGTVYCGTVTLVNQSGLNDAQVVNGIVYDCSDSVHCLQ
tara:strand:+ start:8856 stop:9986 length:1131 start_codon:yes stop_codon:yes gene_type:complete